MDRISMPTENRQDFAVAAPRGTMNRKGGFKPP